VRPERGAGTEGEAQESFTIVEAFSLTLPGGAPVLVECAAVRFEDDSPVGAYHSLIRLEASLPPACRLPEDFSVSELRAAPALQHVAEELRALAGRDRVVTFRSNSLIRAIASPGHEPGARTESASPGRRSDVVELRRLHKRLTGTLAPRSLEKLADAWNVFCPDDPRAEDRVTVVADVYGLMLAHAAAEGSPGTGNGLPAEPQPREVPLEGYAFGPEFLHDLPSSPGIYLMSDVNGEVVYVGKAKNLNSRVNSYFRSRIRRDEKTDRILEAVYAIDIEQAGSELEALLMEYRRIKELRPRINVQYDVHERPRRLAALGNAILILPSQEERCAELFLISTAPRPSEAPPARTPIARLQRTRVFTHDPDAARAIIERTYFAASHPDAEEADEGEVAIVRSWLARHSDYVSRIDVDQARDGDDVMRLLREHLADEAFPGSRVYRV